MGISGFALTLAGRLYQAASLSRSRGSAPGGSALTLAGECPRRLRAHARGGVPPLRRWGALRTEPPLRMSAYIAYGRLLVVISH